MQPSIASVQYPGGHGQTRESDGLSAVLRAGPADEKFSKAAKQGQRWLKASPQEILEVDPEKIKTATNFAHLFRRFGQRGKNFRPGDEGKLEYPAARVYLAKIQRMVVQQGTYASAPFRAAVIARSDALIGEFRPCSTGNHAAGGGCVCDSTGDA